MPDSHISDLTHLVLMPLNLLVRVRMGAQELSDRWLRARRALMKRAQDYADLLVEMVKRHTGELPAFDDPLEAAFFLVLIEILKEIENSSRP